MAKLAISVASRRGTVGAAYGGFTMAQPTATPATAAHLPKWLQAVCAAWPWAQPVSNGTISTRVGLYGAQYLCLQGMPWAQAVTTGMLAVGTAIVAHIGNGGAHSLRYQNAQYLQRALGNAVGQPATAAQLLTLTPQQVASALAKYANFTASVANYNGIATATANGSQHTPTPVYVQPITAAAQVAAFATGGAQAVTTGWQGQAAAQPAKGYVAPKLPKVVAA